MEVTDAQGLRIEVMKTMEKDIDSYVDKYLIPVEKIWQPSDFLPDSESDTFMEEVRAIREQAKDLSYDFWIVMIGDMVTEEALPTYESWLLDLVGVNQREQTPWSKWVRCWSGEENRHGDLLNKYIYLSGRVNMREVEMTTQHLINDGFDPGTSNDPYRNFIYTSFQELATYISHKRVAEIATAKGNKLLARLSKIIAGDEMRHHLAYKDFVSTIFTYDPSEMMIAFADMMKKKIVMPSKLMRESGGAIASAFEPFSNAAQRLGVYTSQDYVDILSKLINQWKIDEVPSLSDEANKARDYLMKLPGRLTRIAERISIPEAPYKFKWVEANGVL